MKKTALILVLAAGTLTGGLAAQQHQHGEARRDTIGHAVPQEGGMGMMQEGMSRGMMTMMRMMPAPQTMMHTMRFAPTHVRVLAHTLGLTVEQVGLLDELIEHHGAARHDMMQAIQAAGRTLSDLFDAEVLDAAAIRSAALAAFGAHAEMDAQMLVEAAVVRSILTPAQRERVMR